MRNALMKQPSSIKSALTMLSLASFVCVAAFNGPLFAEEDKESEKPEVAESEKEGKDEKFDVEVTLTGNDQMMYDKKAFTVKSGQRVKLIFKNVGVLPKVAMGHNVVILKKDVNKQTFAVAAMTAGPISDYLPEKKDEILAYTKLLGPKEEQTIYFTAPDPGKYDYVCTFPGHVALMNGVMTVTP